MSQPEKRGPFALYPNCLQWEGEGELFWIEADGPDVLHFRSSKSLRIAGEDRNMLHQPEVDLGIQIDDERAVAANGKILAEIRAGDGRVAYLNQDDEVLLREAFHHHGAGLSDAYPSVLPGRAWVFVAVGRGVRLGQCTRDISGAWRTNL